MTGQTRCRMILQQLKDALKTEKRAAIRDKIASYGLEFNDLLMSRADLSTVESKVNEIFGLTKVCSKCRKKRSISDFGTVTSTVNGRKYYATRGQCKCCMSEQQRGYQKKYDRKIKDSLTAY